MDEVLRKKTHAQLKLLRKAVKKAKQFEIQKAIRRLKQANADKTAEDNPPAEVAKLEAVLASLRSANVGRLTDIAASSVGITPTQLDSEEESDQAQGASHQETAQRRILSSKCVTEQLDAMLVALEAIEAGALKRKQREGVPDVAIVGVAERDEVVEVGEPAAKRLKEVASEAPDGEATAALAKLLAARKTSGQASSEDEDSGKESSGVVDDSELGELEEEDEDGDGTSSDAAEAAEGASGALSNARFDDAGKKKAKKEPKKSKNRLGQRARRKLAEQAHGRGAVHLYEEAAKAKPLTARDTGAAEGAVEHPSWAARRDQKAKQVINLAAPTTGRKTVFESGKVAKSPAAGGSKGEEEGPLHPSWVLKKKLAEKERHIQPAQGTRMVFDSDNDE